MTDIALIRRWREVGDAQAFNQIASLYAPMVHGACVRILGNAHDAQDAAQDCFLTLSQTRKLPRDHFSAWLHVVASNCARKRLRSERRRRERESRFAASAAKYSEATWDEISAHIDEAIAALDPELGSLVVSHFLQGQSQTELANKLGLSRQTVTHRIGRATEQIRASLKKKGLITTTAVLAAHIAANTAEAVPAPLAEAIGKLALTGPSITGAAATGWLGSMLTAKSVSVTAACAIGIVSIAAYVSIGPANGKQSEESRIVAAQARSPAPEHPSNNPSATKPLVPTERTARPNTVAAADVPPRDVQHASSNSAAGGLVAGVVVLPDGKPFVGAKVHLETSPRSDYDHVGPSTTTGGDGAFELHNVTPARYSVQVMEPGTMVYGKNFELTKILIGENENVTDLRLVYGTEGTLSLDGKVVDTKKKPVEGASISTYGPVQRVVVTDASGRFHLRYLPSGVYKICADKITAKYSSTCLSASAGDKDVSIVLKGRGRVAGRVIRADSGQPIQHFEANASFGQVLSSNNDMFTFAKKFDDPQGRFLLSDLYVGDVIVGARADGFIPSFAKTVVDENETVSNIEIRLEPGNPTEIHGHVVTADGTPISGAAVYPGPAQDFRSIDGMASNAGAIYTDGNGEFTFQDRTQSLMVLSAYHAGFADGAARVSSDTVITLERPALLRVVVRNGGQPADKVSIEVLNRPQAMLELTSGAKTNSDGIAVVKDLVPGLVRVDAKLSDERTLMHEVVLRPGETSETEFDFGPADALLQGRITLLGEPPPHAEVELHIDTESGPEVLRATAETDGTYSIAQAPQGVGTIVVEVRDETYTWRRRARRYEVSLVSQNSTTLDINLEGTARAEGRIANPKYPEVYVTVLEGRFTFDEAKSELSHGDFPISQASFVPMQQDGSFNVENLESGTYTFVAAYRSQANWEIREFFASTTATVQNGSVTEVQLTAQP